MRAPVLVGTYSTGTESRGVYRLSDGGAELAQTAHDPSYLLSAAQGLYWVDEALGQPEGRLCFAARGGAPVIEQPSRGESPCHLAISPDGRWLAVANYSSGSIALYRLSGDGQPMPAGVFPGAGAGADPARQEGPHAHFVHFADEHTLWCCDLGCDIVRELTLIGGAWREGAPRFHLPAGAGPRHMVIRSGIAYILCELNSMLYSVSIPSGALLSGTRCVPEGAQGTAAAIKLGPDGRLYTSHRGSDLISVFDLRDAARPRRAACFPCGGAQPRDLLPLEDCLLCACQGSDRVTSFIPTEDGGYQPSHVWAVPCPVCLIADGEA